MLGILFGILKITGSILLLIILLFILGICLIALVPVRYKINFKYKDDMDLYICVSWLLHLVQAEYGTKSKAAVKIFGVKLFNNKTSLRNSSEQNRKRTPEKKAAEPEADAKQIDEAEKSDKAVNDIAGWEEETTSEKIPDKSGAEKSSKRNTRRSLKLSPKVLCRKIKLKLFNTYKRLKHSLIRLCSSVKNLEAKINDKALQKTLRKLFNEGYKVTSHCLPRRISGYLKFGFGEPYATGTVLRYTALFLPLYKNKFEVIPMFEENIIEMDIELTGRIRIGAVLIAILRLYLNKDIRKWIKRFL